MATCASPSRDQTDQAQHSYDGTSNGYQPRPPTAPLPHRPPARRVTSGGSTSARAVSATAPNPYAGAPTANDPHPGFIPHSRNVSDLIPENLLKGYVCKCAAGSPERSDGPDSTGVTIEAAEAPETFH